jgi:nitrite reductase/ring-hydroxylating ferredoxin subunit
VAWQRVCKLVEIAADQPHLFEAGAQKIAVARVGDEVFAVDDRCTHEEWSLCEGYVEGTEIVCGLHQARFDLRTGAVTMAPATEPLGVFPARVDRDEVWIDPDAREVKDT